MSFRNPQNKRKKKKSSCDAGIKLDDSNIIEIFKSNFRYIVS